MCEPTTAIAIGATVLGGVVSAIGQVQAGNEAKAAADYNAAVARNNKIIADRAAADAIERGAIEAREGAIRTAQFKARQRVSLAANGVLVDEGSALDLTADTDALGKFEELRIRNNAAREALGFQTQGVNFEAEARLQEFQGASAQRAGITGAGATILGTAGSVATKWNKLNGTTRQPNVGGIVRDASSPRFF